MYRTARRHNPDLVGDLLVAGIVVGATVIGVRALNGIKLDGGSGAPGSQTVLSQIPGFIQNPLSLPTADARLTQLIQDWFERSKGWNPFGLGVTGIGAYNPCDYNAFLNSLYPIDRPVAPDSPPKQFTDLCISSRNYTTPGGLGY
jgi:hypothetical protein